MQSGPGFQGHLQPETSLSEPPSSPYDFLGPLANIAMANVASRINPFQTLTFQRNAQTERLHFGGVFVLRSTLESGEHHGQEIPSPAHKGHCGRSRAIPKTQKRWMGPR